MRKTPQQGSYLPAFSGSSWSGQMIFSLQVSPEQSQAAKQSTKAEVLGSICWCAV